MGLKGITGRIAWVDLKSGQVTIEQPDEELYLKYLGGYGLGAYYLFTRQKAGVDALGPEALFGLSTGPLTGTDAITGNRFTAFGKSPKTGGFGDANCGGKFGPALKQAGLDAVYFVGAAEKPVYAVVENGGVTLKDASEYWGLGCLEAEAKFKDAYGKKAESALIGPAGERMSALACIINDKGRAAGRSGLGQVMGSKKLKALVAVPGGPVEVADAEGLKALRKSILKEYYKDGNPLHDFFHITGTPGVLPGGVLTMDTPIKNWAGTPEDFPTHEKISAGPVLALEKKKYGCWKCPLACGGHVKVESGPYAGEEGHKPEYETLGAFGSMCLNDNLESIVRANNICNDGGLDTISAGATVAFAIECFESGLISVEDTGGLELTWGNQEAIVALTEQFVTGEGFGGQVLGDGIKAAVEKLGPKAKEFAMECGGEELPMHDPRCTPGYGTVYTADATPGRHTQMSTANVEGGFIPPEFPAPAIADPHEYSGKGESQRISSAFSQIVNAAGICLFASCVTPATDVPKFLSLALGKEIDMEEMLQIGERIASLRLAFNLREGIRNRDDYKMPKRTLGDPACTTGPVKGVTVDNETQVKDYFEALGWNAETGAPKKAAFEKLGLDFALEVAED